MTTVSVGWSIVALAHVHGEHPQVDGQRRAERLARAHVEPALVQRALDLPVFQEAVAEAHALVRADAVRGEHLAIDPVQREVALAHADADHLALCDGFLSGHDTPACSVAHIG
jgi:hypothetical protein